MSVFRSYMRGQVQRARDEMPREERKNPMQGYGALQDAFASVESEGSGGYSAIGPDTGKGRAYGRYQVMDFNIPAWTREVLGVEMSPDEFLANPRAQDAVFNAKMRQYTQKYGTIEDAASMWFSGRPYAGNNRSDGYLTVPEYVQKVTNAYNPIRSYG